MKWNEVKNTESFCILPFIHAATLTDGQTPLCCVSESSSSVSLNQSTLKDHWNSEYIRSVRKDMLSGKKVTDCRRCYEEEKSGCRSHRLIENKAWEEKLGPQHIDSILEEVSTDGMIPTGIITVDLRLGNTCNLQCIMCQPRESSKWKAATPSLIKEIHHPELFSEWKNKSNIQSQNFEWYKNEKFWNHLKSHLPSLKELIIGGGEPMLIKEHLEFIKYCVESGDSKHIHLRYHTNLTVFPEEMIPYWEAFEKVEFLASIDGLGGIGEYIRYPSQWEMVKENLFKVDQLKENIELRILFSVNALNMHHVPDFVSWVLKQNFKKSKNYPTFQGFVTPGIVHWPKYLSVKVLPVSIKREISKNWDQMKNHFQGEDFDKYEGILNLMNSENESHLLPLLTDYLRSLDKTRKTDFYSLFPMLSEHFLAEL